LSSSYDSLPQFNKKKKDQDSIQTPEFVSLQQIIIFLKCFTIPTFTSDINIKFII